MTRLIEVGTGDAIPAATASADTAPLTQDELSRHEPDRHLMLVDDHGAIQARASCWWTSTPLLPQHRVGLIGHYAASTEASGLEVLREALTRLERAGCTIAVGPMDGNTWRRYRFIAERGSEPAFFLEPDNPDEWREQFERAGFSVMATYTSALSTDLTQEDPRLARTQASLAEKGITIRTLRSDDADTDLRGIFRLSLESFQQNYLYTAIAEDEFLEQNRRVLPYVLPELVLLAEREGHPVGFLFAVPDILQRQRGSRIDTIIIKTVAVSPTVASAGLGGLLVGLAQRRARELWFSRAIHALMHEQNLSRNISRHYARTIRRYALFVRPLSRSRA